MIKNLFVLIIVAMVSVALYLGFKDKPAMQKAEAQIKQSGAAAKDNLKEGAQKFSMSTTGVMNKVKSVSTEAVDKVKDVSAEAMVGMKDFTTNALAKTKAATTNLIGGIKQKFN